MARHTQWWIATFAAECPDGDPSGEPRSRLCLFEARDRDRATAAAKRAAAGGSSAGRNSTRQPRPSSTKVLPKKLPRRLIHERPCRPLPALCSSATSQSPSTAPVSASRSALVEPVRSTIRIRLRRAPPRRGDRTGSPALAVRARVRAAPSATRTAISRWREAARMSSRFATFTQPTSRTSTTEPKSTQSTSADEPTT